MPKPTDPAFPIAQSVTDLVDPGLTKREYIAASNLGHLLQTHGTTPSAILTAVKVSVFAADALIEQLEKA